MSFELGIIQSSRSLVLTVTTKSRKGKERAIPLSDDDENRNNDEDGSRSLDEEDDENQPLKDIIIVERYDPDKDLF